MEEKERYEVMSPSLNGYAYIHDFKTDNVLNTYDSCDLLNQQSKRIKELEEENNFLEKRNEELIIDRRDICLERNDIFEENQQLKQQLAEKEKEIESLKDNWNILCDYLGNCVVKYDEEDINGIYSEVLEKANKLKKYDTSIAKTQNQKALEQLEKVKSVINASVRDDHIVWDFDIKAHIDNQIKQLKEGK